MEDNYNIYIDIDSLLDFRLKVIESLGFNIEDTVLVDDMWSTRVFDSVLGVDSFFINSLIETEMDAMFSYCERTDIGDLLYKVYLDGYDAGITYGHDITINLDIDIKNIPLDEESQLLLVRAVRVLLPSTVNVNIVRGLTIDNYNSLIIYNSIKLLENIVALDKDYTGKKLYTPFLMERLVEGIKPKRVVSEMIEGLAGYIDIDYPSIEHFSALKKKK